ncbi:MAG: FAD-binding protein [Xanthobacteraceae bacterium]
MSNVAMDADADREVDLLIAGAGTGRHDRCAGRLARGLEVLLCEKSDQVGGTGSTSAGTLWIPGNRQNRAAGFSDSSEQADLYLNALIGEATNSQLRDAYLQTEPTAIDYLCARTDVQFLACGTHPDYRSNMPGAAVGGRAIVPEPLDGRLLGAEFRRIRPPVPEFMVFGGMMVGKTDIPRLIGRFHSIANLFRKTVRAVSRRPAAVSARHAHHDGQCAHRSTVL